MKKIIIAGVFLSIVFLAGISAQEWGQYNLDGGSFQWKLEKNALHVIIEADTTGWVAVGFDPSSFMKDANIIIGYVKDGEAVIDDQYGNGAFSHRSDTKLGGTADVTVIGGEEKNGKTRLEFSIPLNSGDRFDRKLAAGSQVKVIFAYARNGQDNFFSKHSRRTSFTVTL